MFYGQMWMNQKMMLAHRASWVIHYGEIPAGKKICHKCDVPSCVNPDHLFMGSIRDNFNDAVSKKRVGRSREGRFSSVSACRALWSFYDVL